MPQNLTSLPQNYTSAPLIQIKTPEKKVIAEEEEEKWPHERVFPWLEPISWESAHVHLDNAEEETQGSQHWLTKTVLWNMGDLTF